MFCHKILTFYRYSALNLIFQICYVCQLFLPSNFFFPSSLTFLPSVHVNTVLCSHPLQVLPSHHGLKSMMMFLLESWAVEASFFTELVITMSPYRPITALAGELTDSLILLPFCSTILASQRSSSRWSTRGMMTWVPLDTKGRGPTPERLCLSCVVPVRAK